MMVLNGLWLLINLLLVIMYLFVWVSGFWSMVGSLWERSTLISR